MDAASRNLDEVRDEFGGHFARPARKDLHPGQESFIRQLNSGNEHVFMHDPV